MAKANFKLDVSGLNKLMKSEEMKVCLQAAGEEVAAAADGVYGVRVHEGNWTAIANVYAEDEETRKKNLNNNELLKAIGAAGLQMGK